MENIKEVVVFDFDKTMIFTAESTDENRDKVFQKYGHRHQGWWARKESLDIDIFYPVLNTWVYEKYIEAKANPDAIVILMTGRITQLEPEVRKILDFHNLEFHRVYCNTGGDTYRFKQNKFELLLREFYNADLTMYDDRTEHVIQFQGWARSTPRNINIVHVK